MSDKFFFKGRQDARENHVKSGYATKANIKAGTKKNPLSLVVTNEDRKLEVAAMVAEANLFADIKVDANAVEAITPLTAVLSKQGTVTLEKVPARNEPCLCGSGKKYKKCCG